MAQVKDSVGVILQEKNFTVVKKEGQKGALIQKHNHPEANVIVTVVKGKIKTFINETESFELVPGKILHFDGDNYINAEFLEDSEIFVTLILK